MALRARLDDRIIYMITSGSMPFSCISVSGSSALCRCKPFAHASMSELYVITPGSMPFCCITASRSSAFCS